MEINFDKLFIIQLSNLMPFLKPFLITFFLCQLKIIRTLGSRIPFMNYFMEELAPFWIINRAQEVVDHRKLHSAEQKRVDLLQLMIDAKVPDEKDKLVRLVLLIEIGKVYLFIIGKYGRRNWTEKFASR